ncbi:MAG: hypothetical protein IPG31_00175 [Nitrosomonas sp.]|nr:hypothetical protein [Nitrosomonas sp.]
MKTYKGITVEDARELWSYNPANGELIWKVGRGRKVRAGMVAGGAHRAVRFNNRCMSKAIIAFGIYTGAWPKDGEVVLFKDKDVENLKWDNLACGAWSKAAGAYRMNSNNTSGVRGVHWDKQSQKWRANIYSQGKNRHLGRFETIEKAAAARHVAAKEYFGEFCNEVRE